MGKKKYKDKEWQTREYYSTDNDTLEKSINEVKQQREEPKETTELEMIMKDAADTTNKRKYRSKKSKHGTDLEEPPG